MRNPEYTKVTILEASGKLFNVKGYKATSLSDITNKTGLTKGAIYSHFGNKATLEKEALKYMIQKMFSIMGQQIKAKKTAPEKLKAIFSFYKQYTSNEPIHGGCPMFNAAVEADDAHPELKEVVNNAMKVVHQSCVQIIEKGIKYKQLQQSTDPVGFATVIFSSLEGAIMFSKMSGDKKYIQQVIQHLESYLEERVM
ncbi:MAG: TetR/AcrR family transcriptional regulator [Saprospiraceae bacterium]|nr:TetR/AcrR family transcriptional regulator [Saprospiraceae bacterium]